MKSTGRRMVSALLSAMMGAALLSSVPAFAAETDLNGDGVIDVFDYILAKRSAIEDAEPLKLIISDAEAVAGETVEVSVELSDNPGCISMALIMDYSPELIPVIPEDESNNITVDSDSFSKLHPVVNLFAESHRISYETTGFKSCYDNGTLFTAAFQIPEDALPGTSYTMTLSRHDIYGTDYSQLSMLTGRGRITVAAPVVTTAPPVTEPIVTEPPVTPYVRTGIDISVWQGNVDFTKFPKDISFVMMRAGYGRYVSQTDKQFVNNYNKAVAAGIPVGAYWYSYALSPEEARLEARVCMQVLGGRKFQYPIAFDIEEKSQFALGIDRVSAIVDAFCSEMEAGGYYVSIYCSAYYLNNYISKAVRDRYDVWVAHYNTNKPAYNGSYNMWQYTPYGSVSGISGNVDMDYCYCDYPAIMARTKLNNN